MPTGITFASEDAPAPVAGDLFFGSFAEGSIHRVELDPDREQALSDERILSDDEGVVGLAWGPEGLYYSTPSAVKLLPLRQKRDASPPPSFAGSGGGSGSGGLLTAVFAVLGGAILLVAVVVLGRRRPR